MMRRDGSLSDSCAPGRCTYSWRVYIYINIVYTYIVLWFSSSRSNRFFLVNDMQVPSLSQIRFLVPKDGHVLKYIHKQFSDFFTFFAWKTFHFKFLVLHIFRQKISTKNWVSLRFHLNSDLHTFQKILRKGKKNIAKKNEYIFFSMQFFFRFFFS